MSMLDNVRYICAMVKLHGLFSQRDGHLSYHQYSIENRATIYLGNH